jgi:hypothetical protein
MTEVAQPTAEIIPFPLRRTPHWRNIQEIYAGRHNNGKYSKANYAKGVIEANTERLQRLGVAQKYIDSEIASLRALLWRLDGSDDEKVRA